VASPRAGEGLFFLRWLNEGTRGRFSSWDERIAPSWLLRLSFLESSLTQPSNHIFSHTPDTLADWCEGHNMPRFRAKQILEWVYEKGIADPAQMSNLSKLDRETLSREMVFLSGDVLEHQRASDGVQKLLIQWHADAAPAPLPSRKGLGEGSESPPSPSLLGEVAESSKPVRGVSSPLPNIAPKTRSLPILDAALDTARQTECVLIPTEDRNTACISSQVGCPVGCKFCASGLGGLDMNLTAGRIVEQVWLLRNCVIEDAKNAPPTPGWTPTKLPRISNVVFMGMGEPLSNFVAVTDAIRTIAALWGFGISARKITISTVGLPKYIDRLANEFELPVTLALSLHAPNDAIRRQLIPWSDYTTIADLLVACQKWFDKTGREITLEYTLLRDVNDRPEHARELADLAQTLRANVNLIRYNEVSGLPFKRPMTEDVREFQEILRARHINVHIRASRGRDIAAACGQLRHDKSAAGAT
jgi:23S rRNA (adenine2503-C2)-methyltransferase